MEIEFYGANCFRVKTKKASLVFDDNLDMLKGKNITKEGDALFYTQVGLRSEIAVKKARLTIDSAGEFEVGDVSVHSVQTRAHMDEDGEMTAAVHQCLYGGKTITVLGHAHPDLSDDVLELIGGTDVLILPVGGNGYTLDPVGATTVIKKVEPEVVVPAYYDDSSLSFEVPAAPLDDFMKTSALSASGPLDIYKIDKPDPELASQLHAVLLNKK